MHYCKHLFILSLLITFTFALSSCDDSSSPSFEDPGDLPALPDLNQMLLETGLFANDNVPSQLSEHQKAVMANQTSQYSPDSSSGLSGGIRSLAHFGNLTDQSVLEQDADPFALASMLVMMYQNVHYTNLSYIDFFTLNVIPSQVEVSGDEFFWGFESQNPENGDIVIINVTASVSGDDVHWSVIGSADLEEGGFDEQQIIDGTSSFDGTAGEWSVMLDAPEEGFVYSSTFSWDYDEINLNMLDIVFNVTEVDGDFFQNITGSYSFDDTTASINNGQVDSQEFEDEVNFGEIDITQPFNVSWDVDDESGGITIDGHDLCWDGTRSHVDC